MEPGQWQNGAAAPAGNAWQIFRADGGTGGKLPIFGPENPGMPGFRGETQAKSEPNLLAAGSSGHSGNQKRLQPAQREFGSGTGSVLSSGAAAGGWAGKVPQRPGMGRGLRIACPPGPAAVPGGVGIAGKNGEIDGLFLLFVK